MNYTNHPTNKIKGTAKQGTVSATYQDLQYFFGEALLTPGTDFKTNHLWAVEIEGILCTIYDYRENLATGKVEEWHVGGNVSAAPFLVAAILKGE